MGGGWDRERTDFRGRSFSLFSSFSETLDIRATVELICIIVYSLVKALVTLNGQIPKTRNCCEILAKVGHVNCHRYHVCQEANLLCKIKITSFKLKARPQHACVCECVCGGEEESFSSYFSKFIDCPSTRGIQFKITR